MDYYNIGQDLHDLARKLGSPCCLCGGDRPVPRQARRNLNATGLYARRDPAEISGGICRFLGSCPTWVRSGAKYGFDDCNHSLMLLPI
jgi:hypothetical protein